MFSTNKQIDQIQTENKNMYIGLWLTTLILDRTQNRIK